MKKKNVFEVCAICGRVADKSSGKEDFKCEVCGNNICVVLPRKYFIELAKKFGK
ncbi:MAG: hypothetical protein QXF86_03390 [Candidatus Bilamarchaeaceae archaeon]